jgi:hypothetical protein
MKLSRRKSNTWLRAAVSSTILFAVGSFFLYFGAWIYLFAPIKGQVAVLVGSLVVVLGVSIIIIGIACVYSRTSSD